MSADILRVLLIEDDTGDAILVERTLQRCRQPFALRQSERLEDALQCLSQGAYDVVLLDLSLPDSFGLSGLERLKSSVPDIPIVVLTGLADDQLALQALDQGAQDYLIKGETTAELLDRTLRYAIQRQKIQTENRRLLARLEALAGQDPLTGVLNRHAFAERLTREWQRGARYGHPLACVVFDLDFFKRINDTYGHAAGDRTLQEVAQTVCRSGRTADLVGRLGGEEFCVLLPETNEEFALVWAERVRREISDLVISPEREQLQVTASLGVAACMPDSADPQQLIERADEAMFAAKQLGRDQVISFSRLRGLGRPELPQIWAGITLQQLAAPLENCLAPWQSLKDAIRLLRPGHAGASAVLNAAGELVGVIGKDDILAATLTSGNFDSTVGDLMQRQPVTFPPDTAAREVCEFLCRSALRQVFVVDESGPVGVVRSTDFVRWLDESIAGQRPTCNERIPTKPRPVTRQTTSLIP